MTALCLHVNPSTLRAGAGRLAVVTGQTFLVVFGIFLFTFHHLGLWSFYDVSVLWVRVSREEKKKKPQGAIAIKRIIPY